MRIDLKNTEIRMTQKEFDEICDIISSMEYQCGTWYPSMERTKKIIKHLTPDGVAFLLWISDTSEDSYEKEGREVIQMIRRFLYKKLIIE